MAGIGQVASGQGASVAAIQPGVIARVTSAVRYALTGQAPTQWFGPLNPLPPVAQEQARGRQFDYVTGANVRYTPRADEEVTFAQLRGLAKSYDLVALLISTRIDQISRMKWTVVPKDDKAVPDARCAAIADALEYPDRDHNWDQWSAMLVGEMLTIDAATIYPRMTRGGDVYSLDLIDGATIKPVISADGRTPMAPDPAYQQIIKGVPAADYHRDELIYAVRRPQVHKVYGFSPVEQVIMTINIALRRQMSQIGYYTDGNIPAAFVGVPKEWNPDQIRMFNDYWNSIQEDEAARMRRLQFIPGGMDVQHFTENPMKDEFDEWIARVVCFAFSVAPAPFVKDQNRATAATAAQAAAQEGLEPLMKWLKVTMDRIISRWFGAPDIHFMWQEETAVNPLEQAQIAEIYVASGIILPDEARADIGREPLTDEQRAQTPAALAAAAAAAMAERLDAAGEAGAPANGKPPAALDAQKAEIAALLKAGAKKKPRARY